MESYCFPFFPLMLLPLFIHYFVGCNLARILVPNLNTDQSSLLALKSQITSDPYNILTNNWTSKTSVCSWIGVTCGSRHNRVTALSIPHMSLRGMIVPEIGNFSFLVSLNMSNNFFYGNLPMELAHLRRLRVFDFYGNNITGELPKSWFGSLHQLEFLNLGRNSLQGIIPLEIGNFSKLEVLVLEFNQLSGLVPPTIFNISTLEKVYLYDNALTGSLPNNICSNYKSYRLKVLGLGKNILQGQIPLSWCQCSQLQILSLSFNKVSGAIPGDIGNMTGLEELYLYRSNLTGIIPKQIGHLRNLKILNIGDNKIVGVIPQEIGYLYEIEEVDMGNNLLSGTIPLAIFNMSKLKVLDFTINLLSGKIPPRMSFDLPNLEEIYLGENELRGPILSSITNSSNLHILSVSSNNFGGSIPNTLGNNLRFLQILNLGINNFTTTNHDPSTSEELNFITSLTNCRNLRVLVIDENPLDAILPSYVGNFSESLKKMYASICRLKGRIPKEIGNLSSLEVLSLSGNDLVGFIPLALQGLQKIEQLGLDENKLIGYFPNSFCTFQNLGYLSLSGNQISGPIPECLGNVTSLRYLYLVLNKFNSTIPAYLWNLTDLLVLDLSSNFLSGSLSPNIGNLKVAAYINMSRNVFSGPIPATIGSLVGLINMSLAHNRLQGPIPDSVSKMLNLETLDLSENNLSGVIPKSLETLQHLTYFNVSFNNLSGEIPSDGPFTNFTDQSFMFNNKDLCGAFQFGVPPCAINSLQTPRKKKKFNKVVIVSLGVAVGIIIALAVLVLIKYRKKSHNTPNVSLLLSPQRHRRISYYELQQATNWYNDSNLLGTGGFSSVYKGVLQDGTLLAVKVFTLEVQGSLKGFDAECEVLRNLRHRNLTKVICSCSNEDFKALVLDYMPNGSLDKWLYSHNYFLDIAQRLNIMIDVATALEYLHHGYSTQVIHCDLKPSNVLLDEDMVAHVSDFGMSKLLSEEDSATYTKTLATLGYMAPEYGMEGTVSPKCDVYSYGIMLMEVFTRTKPSDEIFAGDLNMRTWVQNSLPNEVMQLVDSNLLDPNDEQQLNKKLECLTSIMELAISCTAQSPRDRITIKDVLSTLEKLKSKLLHRH